MSALRFPRLRGVLGARLGVCALAHGPAQWPDVLGAGLRPSRSLIVTLPVLCSPCP